MEITPRSRFAVATQFPFANGLLLGPRQPTNKTSELVPIIG